MNFPNLLMYFAGQMSLVGPRPHMVKHTSDYSKVVDDYMIRQFIKPGITGWAQINGYRGEITNPEQIQMRVEQRSMVSGKLDTLARYSNSFLNYILYF